MTPRFVLAVVLISLAACGADAASSSTLTGPADASAQAAPESVVVTIARSRFGDPELRIAAGTSVLWENTDESAHTVPSTADSLQVFGSGELGRGDTFAVTFDEPGTFPYFCMIHPTMRATVVVE